MKKLSLLLLALIAFTIISCNDKYPDLEDGLYAEIVTNKGTTVAKLYHDQTPMTVANFVSLAEGTNSRVDSIYKGKKYYNGIVFHRVIKDFMIQTGDPLGTGAGDPGYKFPDEFVDSLKHKSKGILSMANSGPATNGSQFFITLVPTPHLDGRHTVFGEVVLGQEVVDSIGTAPVVNTKPKDTLKMIEVNIIRKGSAAKSFDADASFLAGIKKSEEEKAEKEKAEKEANAATVSKYDEIKKKAEKLESGLEITFLNKGDGAQPKIGDRVGVNYAGFLSTGKIFDTNIADTAKKFGVYNERRAADPRGYAPMPAQYSPDAPMIPGFREGIQQMKVGDKAVFFIPAHLGYGAKGAGNVIPANSDLIFDVEIISILEEPKTPGK